MENAQLLVSIATRRIDGEMREAVVVEHLGDEIAVRRHVFHKHGLLLRGQSQLGHCYTVAKISKL